MFHGNIDLLPPTELSSLWDCFAALNSTRGSNGFGPNSITYGEIAAWCHLYDTKLQQWEIEAILRLDVIFVNVFSERNNKGSKTSELTPEQMGEFLRPMAKKGKK